MKGIVFNLLQEIVERDYGVNTWDDLLDAAQLDGAYTSLGSYADEELLRLVNAASASLGMPPQEVIRWFGRRALPLMAEKYGRFFAGHTATYPFLLTLNNIIHPEVLKLYPGADPPEFEYDLSDAEVLVMEYRSARRMCAFAVGLIEGAANHFRETASVAHPQCMLRGNECCVFRISFTKLDA